MVSGVRCSRTPSAATNRASVSVVCRLRSLPKSLAWIRNLKKPREYRGFVSSACDRNMRTRPLSSNPSVASGCPICPSIPREHASIGAARQNPCGCDVAHWSAGYETSENVGKQRGFVSTGRGKRCCWEGRRSPTNGPVAAQSARVRPHRRFRHRAERPAGGAPGGRRLMKGCLAIIHRVALFADWRSSRPHQIPRRSPSLAIAER